MISRPRPITALLTLILTFSLTAPALANPDDRPFEVEGTLVSTHGDDFSAKVIKHRFLLLDDNGREWELKLPAKGPVPLGKRVKVRGQRNQLNEITVANEGITEQGAQDQGETLALASTNRRVAVLLFNFTDDTRTPWTHTQVANSFFGAAPTKSVANYYAEQSYGDWSITGDVLGYYTITASRNNCSWVEWINAARSQATAAGINLNNYSNIVGVFPGQSSCNWGGIAYMPGVTSALNGTIGWNIAVHELGHNFGAHHASTLSCTSGGVRVALSNSCTMSEYGDPFDVLGQGQNLASTWHRKQQDQLTDADQLTATSSGQYTVGVAGSASAPAKITRVARGDGSFFYLEFRQSGGIFDVFSSSAPAVNGVTIRLAPDTERTQTRLIDTTPQTASYLDAPLTASRTFTDYLSGISITTVSVSASGAVVNIVIEPADTTPPTTPTNFRASSNTTSSISLAWTASTDNLGVSGYRLSRNGTLVATLDSRTVSHTDSGLSADTAYTYSLVAFDAAGNVSAAASLSASTAADTTPPTTPTNFRASSSTTSGISLDWGASTDNVGVSGYRLSRNGTLVATLAASATSFTNTGLSAGTAYAYSLVAFDAAGNVSAAASLSASTTANTADTTPPSVPTGLTATTSSGRYVYLSWKASTDNAPGTISYRVFRNGKAIGVKTTSLKFTDRPSTVGTFRYQVRAIDASGNKSTLSPAISVANRK